MPNIEYVPNLADKGKNYISPLRTTTKMNGYLGEYSLGAHALCAVNTEGQLMPFVVGSGTGNKTPIGGYSFPFGAKIYYYDSDTPLTDFEEDFLSLKLLSSHDDVDARYSAVTGTSLNLGKSDSSKVFLRVLVYDKNWEPYYKPGLSAEIIVSSDQLVNGGDYILLGYTSASDNYTIQLVDNNVLYHFDGTDLVPYDTYLLNYYIDEIETALAAI